MEEVELHELTPDMIISLNNRIDEYNQVRQETAARLQRHFNNLVSRRLSKIEALLCLGIPLEVERVMRLNQEVQEGIARVSEAINFDHLDIPDGSNNIIETLIVSSYRAILFKHYLQQFYLYQNYAMATEIELMLGSDYLDCILTFWRIYRKESDLVSYQINAVIMKDKKLALRHSINWQVYVVEAKAYFKNTFGLSYEKVLKILIEK